MESTVQEKELVSIILPTFNRSITLKRAVASVLYQSYQNWKLIIIDDKSSDNTPDIIESYLTDKRIKYVQLHENVGGAIARNIGISQSKGEYIAFLDDDDEWFQTKLVEQIEVFNKNADAGIITCNYNKKNNGKQSVNKLKKVITLNDIMYENFCGSFSFCMTKKSLLNEIEINPKLKAYQDWDLWIKILSKSNLKCYNCNSVLVNYYYHENERISDNLLNVYRSSILFKRSYWNIMNVRQRYYHLFSLNMMKLRSIKYSFWSKIFLIFKILINIIKSGFLFKKISLIFRGF